MSPEPSETQWRIDEAFGEVDRVGKTNFRVDDAFREVDDHEYLRYSDSPGTMLKDDILRIGLERDASNMRAPQEHEASDISPETRATPEYQDLIRLSNFEGGIQPQLNQVWRDAGFLVEDQEYFGEFYDAIEHRPPIQPESTFGTWSGSRWEHLPQSTNIEDRRPVHTFQDWLSERWSTFLNLF